VTTLTEQVVEVKPVAVPECEACEKRGQKVFLVGGDHYLCAGCAKQYLEGGGNEDAVDAFAATLREMQAILDVLDPARKKWTGLRAAIAKGQEAVTALAAA